MRRLTSGGERFLDAVWTPDGRYVLFGSQEGIFWTRADGVGQPQPLILSKGSLVPRSLTPDGKWLAYTEARARGQLVPLEDENGQLKAGKPEPFSGGELTFSPDGRWLAYSSSSGTLGSGTGRGRGGGQIYVRAFRPQSSGEARQWPISNGGTEPVWSRASNDLLYRSGDQIMAVSYTINGDTFDAGKPRLWIPKLGGTEWDLAPDGRRVAVVTPVEEPEPPKQEHTIVMLENFFDELRRRVPLTK